MAYKRWLRIDASVPCGPLSVFWGQTAVKPCVTTAVCPQNAVLGSEWRFLEEYSHDVEDVASTGDVAGHDQPWPVGCQ